jgi:hypothetical protein
MPDTNGSLIEVYVNLLDEGTPCSRPTKAIALGDGLFKLLPTRDYDPEEESWEFVPGSIVRGITERQEGGKSYLLAVSPGPNNPLTRHRKRQNPGYQCFVCKRGIRADDKFRSTVVVQRGIDGLDSKLGPPQFIFAHGKCLKELIPLTEYSFPELFNRQRVGNSKNKNRKS